MDKATAIKQRAQAHIQRSALNEAMAEYEKLLGIEPLDPYAYILLGDLAVRMKDRDVALKRYGQAVDAYEGQGLCRNAIAVLKKIQRLDTGQIESLRRLADLYARENLMAESMTHYLEFASKCLEAGREEDTKQVLEIVVRLGTPNARVALRVADLCVAIGDRERAAIELGRMAGELELRGQGERAVALRKRAAELAPHVDLAETTLRLVPEEETGAEPAGLSRATPDAAHDLPASADDVAIANDTAIADYAGSAAPAGATPAPAAAPAAHADSVMPGLERMGDLFGPASPASAVPPPSFLDPGFTGSNVEEAGESAASEAVEAADAGEDVIILSAGEETAGAIDGASADADAAGADDMATRIRGWVTQVAAHLDAGDRDAAAAVLAEAASESELLGEITAARRFLLELWELGKREAQVAEKLRETAAACGDHAAEARWTAEIGEIRLADGDWEGARTAFERALALDPEEPLARRRYERLRHMGASAPSAPAATEPAAAEVMDQTGAGEPVAEKELVAEAAAAVAIEPAVPDEPADVALIIDTDIGAHAVPLAMPEPAPEPEPIPAVDPAPAELIAESDAVLEPESVVAGEPVAETLPIAKALPADDTLPADEILPITETFALAETMPLAEALPIAETDQSAADLEAADAEVVELDRDEPRGGAALDGVSALDFLHGNGDGWTPSSRPSAPASAPADMPRAPETALPPAPADSTNDDQLAWVIGRFRRDVSSQLGAGDHASHYDLGMAYMEMGLHQEAIAEFRQAVGGPAYRRRCLELLATCYSRAGELNLAATHWRAALEEATRTGEGILPIRYALALSLAAAGQFVGARDELREIVRSDPSFLDARERLQALEA